MTDRLGFRGGEAVSGQVGIEPLGDGRYTVHFDAFRYADIEIDGTAVSTDGGYERYEPICGECRDPCALRFVPDTYPRRDKSGEESDGLVHDFRWG